MLTFDIDKGPHIIRLSYTPEGFTVGALVSVAGIVVFLFLVAVEMLVPYLKKKRKTEA